jgi:hypothetical protein
VSKRSVVGQHIVSRIDRARRLDRSLTIKAAAKELGISESSYYKMRQGTRTGQGSIKRRVMDPLTPAGLRNAYKITFQTADGSRVASRNVNIGGSMSRADALVARHDPRVRRQLQKQLTREEQQERRRETGSPRWRRQERARLVVTDVQQITSEHAPAFYVRGHR